MSLAFFGFSMILLVLLCFFNWFLVDVIGFPLVFIGFPLVFKLVCGMPLLKIGFSSSGSNFDCYLQWFGQPGAILTAICNGLGTWEQS